MVEKKIFIIDSNIADLSALRAQLGAIGYSTQSSEGLSSISAILEKIKLSATDYIIMDLALPRFEGIKLLKEIKSDLETANIPIFIFTGLLAVDIETRCQDLGSKYYFNKSKFNTEQFVAKFKRIASNLDKLIK